MAACKPPPPLPPPEAPCVHTHTCVPRWMTWYNSRTQTKDHGQIDDENMVNTGANLVWSTNLTDLKRVTASQQQLKGMWSISALCTGSFGVQIFNEPYCAGPTGLNSNWTAGADFVAATLADLPAIVGVFLGDEPEIGGVPYTEMCELSLYLKRALQKVGRQEMFLYYNDGPGSGILRGNELCPGLDYWSLDSYRDSGEAAGVEALYAPLLPKLRGPNVNETNGQGLFVVPGTFWYIVSCDSPCTAPPLGPGPQPHGCCHGGIGPHGQAFWVNDKMQHYWEYARRTPQIVGFNPWHWEDIPSIQPATFSRGAISLSPDLWQWIRWVGFNITTAHGGANQCLSQLRQLCAQAKRASASSCRVCCGVDAHATALHHAGCAATDLAAYCSGREPHVAAVTDL